MSKKEFMVYGCPGGGKTTYTARQAKRAAQKFGSDKVIICSLTKAAASEAAGRDTALNPQNIGTLHSFCYRALGSPQLAETKENIPLWNELHKNLKITAVSVNDESIEAAQPFGSGGDKYLSMVNLLRARLIPEANWPQPAKKFYKKWCDWKNESGLLDFADLIDYGRSDMLFPPGRPKVIFIDEAQDISAAELDLLKGWVSHTEQVVYVGDSDQSLYDWRGASPEVMDISRFDPKNVKKLSQSFRVPRAVRNHALELIQKTKRNELDYEPVDRDGEVVRTSATYRTIMKLEPILRDNTKKTMILCTCGYMVEVVVRQLRKAGIPFHNPYVKRWNPLSSPGVSSAERLSLYLIPSKEYNKNPRFWNVKEFKEVVKNMTVVDTMVRGAKKIIETWSDDLSDDELAYKLREVFLDSALYEFLQFNPEWWALHHLKARQAAMNFPLKILKHSGYSALNAEPSVIVGTIHSVKGGEADNVIVFPDLSLKGELQYGKSGFANRDAILRMFYVAFTRAKDRLILGSPMVDLKSGKSNYVKEVYGGIQ